MQVTTQKARVFRLAKEGSWLVLGQIAAVAGSLVLVRVLTEYLSPAQYGQLALGLTVAGLVNQVVMGGLINGIGRFYSIAAEKQDLMGYLIASKHLLMYATGVIVVAGLLLLAGLGLLGYTQWYGLAAAALVLSVLSGYNSALSGIQNAARQRAIVAFHGGLDAWLKIALALGVLYWLGASSTAVVIGYACSSFLITFSQLIFLRRVTHVESAYPVKDRTWMRQMWAYSLPFSIFGTFTWLQQVSDRWALQSYASVTEVGEYAVLFQLGYTPIALATGLITNFLGPILYQRSGDATDPTRNANVHHLSWRVTQLSLLATLLGFVFTLALHEWLFRGLVAIEYRGDSYLLPWVVLAGGVFSSGQILASKLLSEMRTSSLTMVKIITSLVGVFCNVLGAAFAGIIGVVVSLVMFSLIHFVWIAILSREIDVEI